MLPYIAYMDPMGIQMSPKDVLDTQRISKIWTMWTLKDMRMRILNSVNLGFVERCGKVWKGVERTNGQRKHIFGKSQVG